MEEGEKIPRSLPLTEPVELSSEATFFASILENRSMNIQKKNIESMKMREPALGSLTAQRGHDLAIRSHWQISLVHEGQIVRYLRWVLLDRSIMKQ